MKKISHYLLAPNAWVTAVSVLAAIGLLLCAVGFFANHDQLMRIGLGLMAPLLICGAILLCVVVPVLIVINWKHSK